MCSIRCAGCASSIRVCCVGRSIPRVLDTMRGMCVFNTRLLCRVKYPACARYDARDVRLQYACAALQCVCLCNRHDASRCRSLHTCGLLSRSLLLCSVSVSPRRSYLPGNFRTGSCVPSVSCPGSDSSRRATVAAHARTRGSTRRAPVNPPATTRR